MKLHSSPAAAFPRGVSQRLLVIGFELPDLLPMMEIDKLRLSSTLLGCARALHVAPIVMTVCLLAVTLAAQGATQL